VLSAREYFSRNVAGGICSAFVRLDERLQHLHPDGFRLEGGDGDNFYRRKGTPTTRKEKKKGTAPSLSPSFLRTEKPQLLIPEFLECLNMLASYYLP